MGIIKNPKTILEGARIDPKLLEKKAKKDLEPKQYIPPVCVDCEFEGTVACHCPRAPWRMLVGEPGISFPDFKGTEDSDYQGLKTKYHVFKVSNGEPVDDCFVLRPEKDLAAVEALKTYARSTPNRQLAKDILNWIDPKNTPPFKVGELLYNYEYNRILCLTVTGYELNDLGFWIICRVEEGKSYYFNVEAYGSTVFKSMEDLIKAKEARNGKA